MILKKNICVAIIFLFFLVIPMSYSFSECLLTSKNKIRCKNIKKSDELTPFVSGRITYDSVHLEDGFTDSGINHVFLKLRPSYISIENIRSRKKIPIDVPKSVTSIRIINSDIYIRSCLNAKNIKRMVVPLNVDHSCLDEAENLESLVLRKGMINGAKISSVKKMKKLNNFIIIESYMKNFPNYIPKDHISSIGIINSSLEKLSNVKHFKELDTLFLEKNPITTDETKHLKEIKIKTLYLSSTLVTSLIHIKKIKNLETLFLDNTRVTNLSGICEMKSLSLISIENVYIDLDHIIEISERCDFSSKSFHIGLSSKLYSEKEQTMITKRLSFVGFSDFWRRDDSP